MSISRWILIFGSMSRSTRRTDSSTVIATVGVALGITADEVEAIVEKAVSAATTVIQDEFRKIIKDMEAQLQLFDERLTAVESSASVSTTTVKSLESETADISASVKAMHAEMRQYAIAANDAAQYLRRTNIR